MDKFDAQAKQIVQSVWNTAAVFEDHVRVTAQALRDVAKDVQTACARRADEMADSYGDNGVFHAVGARSAACAIRNMKEVMPTDPGTVSRPTQGTSVTPPGVELGSGPNCKWCAEGPPEWSPDANVWIHRRERLDRRCENPPEPSSKPYPIAALYARIQDLESGIRQFINNRGRHDGDDHVFCCNNGRCLRCESSYIAAEFSLDHLVDSNRIMGWQEKVRKPDEKH